MRWGRLSGEECRLFTAMREKWRWVGTQPGWAILLNVKPWGIQKVRAIKEYFRCTIGDTSEAWSRPVVKWRYRVFSHSVKEPLSVTSLLFTPKIDLLKKTELPFSHVTFLFLPYQASNCFLILSVETLVPSSDKTVLSAEYCGLERVLTAWRDQHIVFMSSSTECSSLRFQRRNILAFVSVCYGENIWTSNRQSVSKLLELRFLKKARMNFLRCDFLVLHGYF
jgi:hypothetical protein